MGTLDEVLGGFALVVMLFLVVLAILWFILPFAIFGTKARLDSLIVKQDQQIELLKKLVSQANDGRGEPTLDVESKGTSDEVAQIERSPRLY